ncbi:siroheme decarboxylase subunit beta [Dethiosulfatarculus sandiegensis]|uniref:siroheme decarboxylase n=1 Tax=Dethiosulfatarculus sandiegensis TaxID=1429043 RepID=A0A0D2GMD7_9BACT|nr:AsnC family transcriptional regulator [Dethiosulfatarculus sandiegensis]KIX15852.1 transcriptional regulator [Dethiosulfatarculus sandiegensis]
MIAEIDKKIIARLQGDLELTPRPFAAMAKKLGLSEAQVVERIRDLSDKGIMRRFGATLRHQQSGFSANVMVAWQIKPDKTEETGEKLAAYRFVSHCYERETPNPEDFPYNLYTMVHGRSKEECLELVKEMAKAVCAEDYALLFSKKELKKTSMSYFES